MSAATEQMSKFLKHFNGHPCVLDNQQYVDKKRWALTLIRAKDDFDMFGDILRDKHVQILYEGYDDNRRYFVKMVHLKAKSNVPLANLPFRCGESVKEKDLTELVIDKGAKAIRYAEKTPTYVLSRSEIELMISRIALTKDDVTFDLLGRHSFFNLPARYLGYNKDSCLTYGEDMAYSAGIKSPSYNSGMVLYSDSARVVNGTVEMEPYDIADLCKLAKEGAIELIKRKFSAITNVNQLVDFPHPEGPVEVFLGQYTPLAIAVAYNQFEVVKLLCEKYGANLNLLSGRSRDYTALDCANSNWWGVKKGGLFQFFNGEPDKKIREYLLKNDAKFYSELKKLNKVEENICENVFNVGSLQKTTTSTSISGASFSPPPSGKWSSLNKTAAEVFRTTRTEHNTTQSISSSVPTATGTKPSSESEDRITESREKGKIARAELEKKGGTLLTQSKAEKCRVEKKTIQEKLQQPNTVVYQDKPKPPGGVRGVRK